MCRSQAHGGRRCPCGNGARRRAYQRGQYALKVASKEAEKTAVAVLDPPIAQVSSGADVYPSHTIAVPVFRDPSRTRSEVQDALGRLRSSLAYSEWANSGELKAYVSATITHGSVLRDNVLYGVEEAWDAAGVSDKAVTALLDKKQAHMASKRELQMKVDSLVAKEERLKKRFPNWYEDPDVGPKIKAVGQEWATMVDEWNNALVQMNKDLLTVNRRREELFTAQVRDVLSGERELGGEPSMSSAAKLSKSDKDMFDAVVGSFPKGMIEFANNRNIPLHAKRSKKRAHYGAMVKQKQKEVRAGVLNAAEALRGEKYWSANQDYVSLNEDGLHDRMVPHRETVDDTPENRALLQQRIEEFKADHPRDARFSAKVPRMAELTYEMDHNGVPTMEKRLGLYIPEAYSQMTTRNSAPTGELTFNDKASIAHEFGHHIEYSNPEVGAACKEFLKRRTEGMEKVVYLAGKRRNGKRLPDEVVVPDGFVDSYIGKNYDDPNHTEVFSMGVEAVFTGAHGGLLGIEIDTANLGKEGVTKRYRSDPEHFALIMGLLASANR